MTTSLSTPETAVVTTPEKPPDPKSRLAPLFATQFLWAFNDNAWKWLVALLLVDHATAGLLPAEVERESLRQLTIAFVVFTLPLMLFSIPAVSVADRFRKRDIVLWMKWLEVVLMLIGTLGLFLVPHGGVLALMVLGAMGLHSAFFSPAICGILPELLPHDRLSEGNASLSMWTFLAMVTGTATGGLLKQYCSGQPGYAGLFLLFLAVCGRVIAQYVPQTALLRSAGRLREALRESYECMREDRVLRLAVIGSIFFWGLTSLLGQVVVTYSRTLTESDLLAVLPAAVFGIGVGVGSVLAGKWSASKVEYGLIPLGALGLAVFVLWMGIGAPQLSGTVALASLVGISSGLLLVPVNALLQWRPPPFRRGGVIALSNVFVFAGVLAGSLIADLLGQMGLSSPSILIASSVATLCGTAWAMRLLPEAFLRLVLVLMTHTFYRLRVLGRENIPQEGGALLVPNHVSFVDGLFLIASTDRNIRFLVAAEYFHRWWTRPVMKALGVIPVSTTGGPRLILRAMRDAGNLLDQGEIVCIFAEGQITRTGMMQDFRRGMERIIKGRSASIIPVHLDGVWGSIFSRADGRFLSKWPRHVPYPVTVSYGKRLPPTTLIHEVRAQVMELGAQARLNFNPRMKTLPALFVRSARLRPLSFAFADMNRSRLSRFHVLVACVALARELRGRWKDQAHVGFLLPPSIGGALVNLSAALAGKVAVNLNFTAGRSGIESAIRQAGLRSVVTSRQFLEKVAIELPGDVERVYLEDLFRGLTRGRRMWAALGAALLPTGLLQRFCGATRPTRPDDLLTIVFSSGSTGEPKGVMLSVHNVQSNVEAVEQAFPFNHTDRLLGILPLFHSFGFISLWLGAKTGLGIVFHPNPLDAAAVGELVMKYRVTVLLATPTFLQLYMKRCTPGEFGSLRFVVAGAEKLSPMLADAFEDQFGIRPLEGYGTTECSPVVAVSTLDFRAPGFFQPGSRRGFLGHPLPGVAVKIVDPDTGETLPPMIPGMLMVKGPNVMQGYLGREDLTSKVLKDGWYETGDISVLDENGFIKITDRLSRFSKIGGEMVPHGSIEEALHRVAEVSTQVFAVTAIADSRKGERLVVLHTLEQTAIGSIVERLSASGLPNLFIPRREAFFRVDALPILGTGKLDLKTIKKIAVERCGNIPFGD